MRDEHGRFLPGHSGNPGGRPRTAALADRLRERLLEATSDGDTLADALVDQLLQAALDGDGQARKLVWEYIEGKPTQAIALDSQMELVTIIDDIPRFTEAEHAEAFERWERGERPQSADEASLWFTFDEYGPSALALVDNMEQLEAACGVAD
ncbi:MAG: DUF5681 domain-containing protein [Coriobacteriia bacterium]|nr:DUF5681 domain-containing protein [Coriobacteriia bacterium]